MRHLTVLTFCLLCSIFSSVAALGDEKLDAYDLVFGAEPRFANFERFLIQGFDRFAIENLLISPVEDLTPYNLGSKFSAKYLRTENWKSGVERPSELRERAGYGMNTPKLAALARGLIWINDQFDEVYAEGLRADPFFTATLARLKYIFESLTRRVPTMPQPKALSQAEIDRLARQNADGWVVSRYRFNPRSADSRRLLPMLGQLAVEQKLNSIRNEFPNEDEDAETIFETLYGFSPSHPDARELEFLGKKYFDRVALEYSAFENSERLRLQDKTVFRLDREKSDAPDLAVDWMEEIRAIKTKTYQHWVQLAPDHFQMFYRDTDLLEPHSGPWDVKIGDFDFFSDQSLPVFFNPHNGVTVEPYYAADRTARLSLDGTPTNHGLDYNLAWGSHYENLLLDLGMTKYRDFIFQPDGVRDLTFAALIKLESQLELIVASSDKSGKYKYQSSAKTHRRHLDETDAILSDFKSYTYDYWFNLVFARNRHRYTRSTNGLVFEARDILQILAAEAIHQEPEYFAERDRRAREAGRPTIDAEFRTQVLQKYRSPTKSGGLPLDLKLRLSESGLNEMHENPAPEKIGGQVILRLEKWGYDPKFAYLTSVSSPLESASLPAPTPRDPDRDTQLTMIVPQMVASEYQAIFTPRDSDLLSLRVFRKDGKSIQPESYEIFRGVGDGGYVLRFGRKVNSIAYQAEFRKRPDFPPIALAHPDAVKIADKLIQFKMSGFAKVAREAKTFNELAGRLDQFAYYTMSIGEKVILVEGRDFGFNRLITRDGVFFGNCASANGFLQRLADVGGLKNSLVYRSVISFENGEYREGQYAHGVLFAPDESEHFGQWIDGTPHRGNFHQVARPSDHLASEILASGVTILEAQAPPPSARADAQLLWSRTLDNRLPEFQQLRARFRRLQGAREDVLARAEAAALGKETDQTHPLWRILRIAGLLTAYARGEKSTTELQDAFMNLSGDVSGLPATPSQAMDILRDRVREILLSAQTELKRRPMAQKKTLLSLAEYLSTEVTGLLNEPGMHLWHSVSGIIKCDELINR